jgi:hypothetical protein
MNSLKRASWVVLLLLLSLFSPKTNAQVDLTGINCAVTPQQVLGQAYVGFAGAAYVGFAGALGEEIQTNNWQLDDALLVGESMYSQTGSNAVAIIIVDDFSSEEPASGADFADASHGWLVLNVFERMISYLPPDSAALLRLETIDMSELEFRSDLLATELEARVDGLVAEGYNRFVVNMSFVFVACQDGNFNHAAWMERRQNNPNLSLIQETGGDEAYVTQVLSDRRVRRIDERGFEMDNRQEGQGNAPARNEQKLAFLRLFENINMNQDSLRQYFMEAHSYTLIPIASSGNFKWKRPFYPAQWPEVLAVSATLGSSTDLWPLSNNGEVSAAGAYFYFDDEAYRAGTSFAAPVVSLMQALDLTNDSPTCGLANNGRPELSSHGQWRDLPLLDAVEERC